MRSRWLQVVLAGLVVLVTAQVRVLDPPVLQDLRLKSFDFYQQLRPRGYVPVPVRFVDIDDETLARLGQWPWPRTRVAALVERLDEAGAATIALDIVFAEPDRTSPQRVVGLWPVSPETELLRRSISGLPDHDEVLARAIDRAKNVVTGFAATNGGQDARPALKAGIAYAGDDPKRFLTGYSGAVTSLPAIAAAGSGSAGLAIKAERDGILRRLPLLISYLDEVYPTLPVEALRVAQGASNYLIKSSGASGTLSFGRQTGITHVRVGRLTIPTDAEGRVWLYDTGPVAERRLPAWRVMENRFDPRLVAGNIVVVGSSAAGLEALHATPLHPAVAGAEIQVQLAEQMLIQDFLLRPDWAAGAELAAVIAVGILLALASTRLGAGPSAAVAMLALGGIVAGSWYLFARHGVLLDPVYPAVAGLAVYMGSSLMAWLRTEGERREVRNAFSHYMSPAMVERLARDPGQLRLGGETRELTLLFSDLRGFTSIAERYDAQQLTRLVNRFLTPMTRVTLAHGGTIDKYMGDAMMAFWNAPLDDPGHARRAARAALELRDCLKPLNRELAREAREQGIEHTPLRIGIGLNTGEACVGNMGSEQRFNYSALGDEVNLASRLEGLSKLYGVDIVISGATRARIADFTAIELDRIRVVGKTVPVTVFALLGDAASGGEPAVRDGMAAHDAMLRAYRTQQWDLAGELVGQCRLTLEGRFGLAEYYDLMEGRIARLRADPPGPDWDGVAEATGK